MGDQAIEKAPASGELLVGRARVYLLLFAAIATMRVTLTLCPVMRERAVVQRAGGFSTRIIASRSVTPGSMPSCLSKLVACPR